MTAKEIEKLIKTDGWYFYNQEGAHRHYKHPTKKGKVTIAFHKGDIPIKTLDKIKEQAGLK